MSKHGTDILWTHSLFFLSRLKWMLTYQEIDSHRQYLSAFVCFDEQKRHAIRTCINTTVTTYFVCQYSRLGALQIRFLANTNMKVSSVKIEHLYKIWALHLTRKKKKERLSYDIYIQIVWHAHEKTLLHLTNTSILLRIGCLLSAVLLSVCCLFILLGWIAKYIHTHTRTYTPNYIHSRLSKYT